MRQDSRGTAAFSIRRCRGGPAPVPGRRIPRVAVASFVDGLQARGRLSLIPSQVNADVVIKVLPNTGGVVTVGGVMQTFPNGLERVHGLSARVQEGTRFLGASPRGDLLNSVERVEKSG